MNVRSKSRLISIDLVLYLLVLAILELAIGYTIFKSFRTVREIDTLPVTFGNMTNDYLRIATRLEVSVTELNDLVSRSALRRDPADEESFERKSLNLKVWITEQKSVAMKPKWMMLTPVKLTVELLPLVNEIDAACDAYLQEARKIVKPAGSRDGQTINPTDLSELQKKSQQLLVLAYQARSQADAIQIFLSGSKGWLKSLHKLMRLALLPLGALSAWLIVVVYRRYRHVVTPLRARLIESDTIIERQEKLAHFGELAAGVAHEIRNPLMAIRARLYTLEKTLAQGTAAREDATMIRNEIHRLDRIVTDFLKLARPSEPQLVPMTAASLLEEIQNLFAAQYEKQSIQLTLESAVDARFLGDPQQLKQVLINLITNAAESIEGEGTITLRARLDTRRLHERESEVVIIEVQDTGSGIPAEIQEQLFDPFFSTKEGGTGLGLSIVTQIVDKNGGKLEFQTRPGEGSTFGIVLPVCKEAA